MNVNESTMTGLKIIVERAVRPVRVSNSHMRKFREELLAHVVGVFEEERARVDDDQTALERTALRFGNPAEVSSELQQSVPAGDSIVRIWEGQPGEATLWVLLRLACVASACAPVAVCVVVLAAGRLAALPRDAMYHATYAFLGLPLYLFSVAFLTDCFEKAFHERAKVSRPRVALSACIGLLFLLLFVSGAVLPPWLTGLDPFRLVPYASILAALSVVTALSLALSCAERRRYHQEWGRLPIEMSFVKNEVGTATVIDGQPPGAS
jgi:hypothetical protein